MLFPLQYRISPPLYLRTFKKFCVFFLFSIILLQHKHSYENTLTLVCFAAVSTGAF